MLHSGLVVMMMSELFTGLYAVEGTMAIDEGGSSNVVIENRHSELAVVSPSPTDPANSVEVVVPASRLRKPAPRCRTTLCRSTWK